MRRKAWISRLTATAGVIASNNAISSSEKPPTRVVASERALLVRR